MTENGECQRHEIGNAGSTRQSAEQVAAAAKVAAPAGVGPPAAAEAAAAWEGVSLQQLRCALQLFAAERDWGKYHTPRNLLLALVGEVGELSECFQWHGEVACGLPGFTSSEREHIGEELSDVLLYLVRLADACGIDLAAAATAKMQKNAAKYPADRCRGSSAKYTKYGEQTHTQEARGQDGEQQRAVQEQQAQQEKSQNAELKC